jgi:hypothetical protein
MRTILLVLTAIASVGTLAAQDYPEREERTFTRTLRFAGTGERTLQVRANQAVVRVTGTAGADVEIEARQTLRARNQADLRDALREVVLDTSGDAATVGVIVRAGEQPVCGDFDGRWPDDDWYRPRYEVSTDLMIRAPRDVRLRVCTIEGDVLTDGMTADFDVATVRGDITMTGLEGAGRMTAVRGSVIASFARTPRDATAFRSISGEVVVTLPQDLDADLRMKTMRGDLFTDFDVTGVVQRPSSGERLNGRYRYRSGGYSLFRVGKGGPELSFDTLSGDVRVLRAAR